MPSAAVTPKLITTRVELAGIADSLAGQDCIAVDTEFNRTNTYRPELCLIQIAGTGALAIVDTLAPVDPADIRRILSESPGLKLFHAAKQDLEALHLNLGLLPNRILDTQIAAALLGLPPQVGYARLVEDLLAVKLDKTETRTDWSRRPLSDAQLVYAAADVTHLFALYANLRSRLEDLGRYDWALEDSARLLNPALYEVNAGDAWQRLPGIVYLPVPVQARARALASWRETRAAQVNRPRQWVLSDKVLLSLAQSNPGNLDELTRTPELPAAVARRQGGILLDTLRESSAAAQSGGLDIERLDRPAAQDQVAIKELGKVLKTGAEELGVAPEFLATRRELVGLLRGELDQPVMSGWRREIIGERLAAAAQA